MKVYKRLKNCPTFIFDNMVNIKDTDLSAISLNKVSITSYEIEYYDSFIYDSPLYLIFNNVDAFFLCINEEKYLVFAATDRNKDILENYKKLWNVIKNEISKINKWSSIEEVKIFGFKDLLKIKFESSDEASTFE